MKCVLIIFGGTGDLANRKLYPAIYNLSVSGLLPDQFAVVSIGRKEKSNEIFRTESAEIIRKFSRQNPDEFKSLDKILSRFYYFQMDFTDDPGYTNLYFYLKSIDAEHATGGNRIFYFATSPDNFLSISKGLKAAGFTTNVGEQCNRIVIEKPFGNDFDSANGINDYLQTNFAENNVYRIDHYLGKEMLQNIMSIRFANAVFEPLWNKKYIDHIQITSSEVVGVENRGAYYEKSGAIRDMMQNHMLQLLMLIAMDPPNSIDHTSIKDEKLKILRNIKPIANNNIVSSIVLGQYGEGAIMDNPVSSYRSEKGVSRQSNTETYCAMKLEIDTDRWNGVPFYLRTGKRMTRKTTEIAIVFKTQPLPKGMEKNATLNANTLVVKVQPQEAIILWLNSKKPGSINEIIPISMGFCQNCTIDSISQDAYERLIYDVIRGDSTLFASWEEVEYSWKFIDSIMSNLYVLNRDFPNYSAGTWGPLSADELLINDGRKWNNYVWRCFSFDSVRCVNANK